MKTSQKQGSSTFLEMEIFATGILYPLIPAKIHCEPENCYPEEGGFYEVHEVYLCSGKDKIEITKFISDDQKKEIEEKIYEEIIDAQN